MFPTLKPLGYFGLSVRSGVIALFLFTVFGCEKSVESALQQNDPELGECEITETELATDYSVIANDTADDTEGLRRAISHLKDLKDSCSSASIDLPAGDINTSKQITIDMDNLVIRGKGSEQSNDRWTRVIFNPDEYTQYGSFPKGTFELGDIKNPDEEGSLGWITPGRAAFRVQTREIDSERYGSAHENSSEHFKDIYEGSVNFHWWAGSPVAVNALQGATTLQLENENNRFQVGEVVWVMAANSNAMFDALQAPSNERIQTPQIRQQLFTVTLIETSTNTITLDRPLEFDLFTTEEAENMVLLGTHTPLEGSSSSASFGKVVPIKAVKNVGFEDFILEQKAPINIDSGAEYLPEDARYRFENVDPSAALHGFVFKWTVGGYLKNIKTFYTGSHAVATEVSLGLEIINSYFEGAWNKGEGGNGYVRLSKAWGSVVENNTIQDLRHLTLQNSSAHNWISGNTFIDSDINLHGGMERYNLIENNIVSTSYQHRACNPKCAENDERWYPIYWSTGQKAIWASASGPQNILFNNQFEYQIAENDPYLPYGYSELGVIYQFGWDSEMPSGSQWQHLEQNGLPILDWSGNELNDYFSAGVNNSCRYTGSYLKDNPPVLCLSNESLLNWR